MSLKLRMILTIAQNALDSTSAMLSMLDENDIGQDDKIAKLLKTFANALRGALLGANVEVSVTFPEEK